MIYKVVEHSVLKARRKESVAEDVCFHQCGDKFICTIRVLACFLLHFAPRVNIFNHLRGVHPGNEDIEYSRFNVREHEDSVGGFFPGFLECRSKVVRVEKEQSFVNMSLCMIGSDLDGNEAVACNGPIVALAMVMKFPTV